MKKLLTLALCLLLASPCLAQGKPAKVISSGHNVYVADGNLIVGGDIIAGSSTATGSLLPNANGTQAIGSASVGWKSAYFSDGTAKGVIDFSSNILRFKTTTAHEVAISTGTSNGADTSRTSIGGGGVAADKTRGAYVLMYGNESAGGGKISVSGGDVADGDVTIMATNADSRILLGTANTSRWQVTRDGHILPVAPYNIGSDSTSAALSAAYFTDGTAKGVIDFSGNRLQLKTTTAHAAQIYTGTADGSDNQYVTIAGGGALGSGTRGARLYVYGNEAATYGGQVWMSAGDVAGGHVKLLTAAANTGVIISALNGAVADADLAASQCAFYLAEGTNVLTVKCKYANGATIKTGTVALL